MHNKAACSPTRTAYMLVLVAAHPTQPLVSAKLKVGGGGPRLARSTTPRVSARLRTRRPARSAPTPARGTSAQRCRQRANGRAQRHRAWSPAYATRSCSHARAGGGATYGRVIVCAGEGTPACNLVLNLSAHIYGLNTKYRMHFGLQRHRSRIYP